MARSGHSGKNTWHIARPVGEGAWVTSADGGGGPDDGQAARSVVGRVRTGLTWSLLNNAVLRLASLVSGIALARILTPEDFGVYAVALTILVLLLSANDVGVSLALVQRPGDVRGIAPTVMTISLVSSVVLYAAVFAAAPTIAGWMDAPEAVGVIRLMSLAVLPDGATMVAYAGLEAEAGPHRDRR